VTDQPAAGEEEGAAGGPPPGADGPTPPVGAASGAIAPDSAAQADLPPGAFPDGATPPRRPGVSVPVGLLVAGSLVVGLLLGLVLGWLLPRPGQGESMAAPDSAAPSATAAAPQEPTELDPATPQPIAGGPAGTDEVAGLVLGTEGPLVELFEDYVCPFCARLEASAGQRLRQGALDGEYRLVLHPIAFLTEDSPRAANASACVYANADQATWISFHEKVYAAQDPRETAGQFSAEVLLGLAQEAGAASPEVTACIEQGTYQAWVGALTEQAFARGVRGTPTLTVDGRITEVSTLAQ